MVRRPPRSTRTDTLFPYTTLFRSTAGVIIGTGQVSAIDLQAEAGVEWLPCERCVHDVEPLLPEAIVRFPEDMRLITIGRIELEKTQLRLQRIVYQNGRASCRERVCQ